MHVDKAALPESPAPRVAPPLDVVVDGEGGTDVFVVGDVVMGDVVVKYELELEEVAETTGIEEVDRFPVPAYLTAGDSCANPMEGGSYL